MSDHRSSAPVCAGSADIGACSLIKATRQGRSKLLRRARGAEKRSRHKIKTPGRSAMHRHALASASLVAIAFATPAMANEDVLGQTAKPEQWVLQTGDYANQRYTKLDQINRENVKNLKVAWTFSTGVLRGHE